MKVLILGGDGMLGHQLFKTMRGVHDVRVTLRQSISNYQDYGLFNTANSFADVDVRSLSCLADALSIFRPEAIVNCIGLVKQRDNTTDVIANLEINALLPHRLAQLCLMSGARLIHISTDCIFAGRKGMYTEEDASDAEDMYGRTKFLGEVTGQNCLTLRTSIIGRELTRKRSLVEWFLAQQATVKGFNRAIFSGVSTAEFSRIVLMMLERFPGANGLYHVSAEPIDKFTLLRLFREHFGSAVEVVPDETLVIDRSLDSSKFRKMFAYVPPSWREMVAEL